MMARLFARGHADPPAAAAVAAPRPTFWDAVRCPESRSRRVAVLLLAIVAMSIADLVMTIEHMVGPGMYESNPLARMILEFGTPTTLAMFKAMTTLIGLWLLWKTRRSKAGEIGAIICLVVLTWLMVRWKVYSDQMTLLTPRLAEIQYDLGQNWVMFRGDE
ncbi:MAG: DUF5658 family protein [Planctomycetota bacterium]